MLSPDSAIFSPLRQRDPDDEDGIPEPSDVITEFSATTNSTMDPEGGSGVDSIDIRLRQSNMSALSRYKVAC